MYRIGIGVGVFSRRGENLKKCVQVIDGPQRRSKRRTSRYAKSDGDQHPPEEEGVRFLQVFIWGKGGGGGLAKLPYMVDHGQCGRHNTRCVGIRQQLLSRGLVEPR